MNIRELAKEAGVSVATISRVINHPEAVLPEIIRASSVSQPLGRSTVICLHPVKSRVAIWVVRPLLS